MIGGEVSTKRWYMVVGGGNRDRVGVDEVDTRLCGGMEEAEPEVAYSSSLVGELTVGIATGWEMASGAGLAGVTSSVASLLSPPDLNTFKELMLQYESWKAAGLLATKSLQVPARLAQDEPPQTAPAQSPPKVPDQ